MEYYLLEQPKQSGSRLAGAFDAIDQAYGTEPFSEMEGMNAIRNVMGIDAEQADALFNELVKYQHIG